MSFQVNRNEDYNVVRASNVLKIPRYSNLVSVGDEPGFEGNLIIDRSNQQFCFHNGTKWVCISEDGLNCLQDGSAQQPSLPFCNHPDTGIFLNPVFNSLAVSHDGNEVASFINANSTNVIRVGDGALMNAQVFVGRDDLANSSTVVLENDGAGDKRLEFRSAGTATAAVTQTGGGDDLTISATGRIDIQPTESVSLTPVLNCQINPGAGLGFFNVVEVPQQAAGGGGGLAFVANTSGIADATATYGGYTVSDIVAALQNYGLLQ